MSRIPVVSTFSIAAYEKQTDTRVVYRWLTQHRELALPEEWIEVLRMLEIAKGECGVMLSLLSSMRSHPTAFARALSTRFFIRE